MDTVEMIEIEMLESQIGRLRIINQNLSEDNERLRSASGLQEKLRVEVLQSKMERMETNFGKILLEHEFRQQELKDELNRIAGERDSLQAELEAKNEEVEQLFLDVQELEKTNQEDRIELGKVLAHRARLMETEERWDARVDRMTEDNTVIILTLLESQNDLEAQLNRKEAIMRAFKEKVLEMMRKTRRRIAKELGKHDDAAAAAGGEVWQGSNEWETSGGGGDEEIENVVAVMAWPVEEKLKEIEAAVAASRGFLKRKELVEEDEEMETKITWKPKEEENSWKRRGKIKGYRSLKGKMAEDFWEDAVSDEDDDRVVVAERF